MVSLWSTYKSRSSASESAARRLRVLAELVHLHVEQAEGRREAAEGGSGHAVVAGVERGDLAAQAMSGLGRADIVGGGDALAETRGGERDALALALARRPSRRWM